MILVVLLFSCFLKLFSAEVDLESKVNHQIVLSTQQIAFPNFPNAFNPSIFQTEQGYVFVFRYCPNLYWDPWWNQMCAVMLDESFEPIGEPDVLSTGLNTGHITCQAEDARVFSYQDKLYLIYNDNIEISRPWGRDRRDIYIAELQYVDSHFKLINPLKLIYGQRYQAALWQKNWTPFEWEGKLLMGYSINPHEIIYANLVDGSCYPCYETKADIPWKFGVLRGSSPAVFLDGEYFSFFHSGHLMKSSISPQEALWHYFMGAYTFASQPPFQITKVSPEPVIGADFYTPSLHWKKVILPGGFVISGSKIYVAYGKDDDEMWIAELDKEELMKSLIPVHSE